MSTWMLECGEIGRCPYNLHAEDEDFGQAATLVRDVLDDAERDRMPSDILGHVSQDESDDVQGRMIGGWTGVGATSWLLDLFAGHLVAAEQAQRPPPQPPVT